MQSTTDRVTPPPAASAARTLETTAWQGELLRALADDHPGTETELDGTWASAPPRLSAEVLSVKRVPAGSGVSYGHTHVTAEETTLALVYLGYGHGLPRKAGNRAAVTWTPDPTQAESSRAPAPSTARGSSTPVRGSSTPVRMPIVGRVAMDVLVVDAGAGVSELDRPIAAGDRVVVFGDPGVGEISIAEWAATVGEAPAVLLACLDARVIRIEAG